MPVNLWDIPYTIPQLGYASHGHFRYYGKFPSSVAAQLLERFPPQRPGQYVLDNFCGSGTTLVEAGLRGIPAIGTDISWLAVLASRVKTRAVDLEQVRSLKARLLAALPQPAAQQRSDPFRDKWFSAEASGKLAILKAGLAALDDGPAKDFLILAFLAIVRRVSLAYDGEVRPHINRRKVPKEVYRAFDKKVEDMVSGHEDFMAALRGDAAARAYVMDNRDLSRFADGNCYLVVSHPPYLNSFAYGPVFSLEYHWGAGLHALEHEAPAARAQELRAWPATDALVDRYYRHLADCYAETRRIQPEGGLLAVVIGDCTRHRVLEPVIEKAIRIVSDAGYRLLERNYRTTHYGLGKYAYDFRAGYHGASQKRDGVFIFQAR
ncbi:MAG: DNA methyltransferase [Sphingomonadales bacterium]